jgi:uncharacterized protein involved in exopolysaccharide biosynthesis
MRERDLRIETIGQAAHSHPTAIAISYQHTDRYKAQRVLAAIISNAVPRATNHSVELLDAPSLPAAPIAPNHLVVAALGMGLGTLGGWIVYWIRRHRRPAIAAAVCLVG